MKCNRWFVLGRESSNQGRRVKIAEVNWRDSGSKAGGGLGITMDLDEERAQFLALLNEEREEQAYQAYLENHTRFIPHEFVQNHGIGLSLVIRKLPFGADYKTDFFYFSKSTDDWNAVFIELEKPSSRFFRGNTNEFHGDFVHALQQINQWKAWFLSDQNKSGFLASVSAIQVPRHMARNPTYNKYVLVFGRRAEYEGNEHRRQLVKATETDDSKIITFDSLAEGLSQKPHLAVGSRHNQFIDILSDEVIDAGMYAWMEPTQLQVSQALHTELSKGGSNHFIFRDGARLEALSAVAPLIRVRPA